MSDNELDSQLFNSFEKNYDIQSDLEIRKVPSPIHLSPTHNNYELTFKKQFTNHLFHEPEKINEIHLTSNQLRLVKKVRQKQIEQFYEASLQQLKQYPFKRILNASLTTNQKTKITFLQSMYQLKKTRVKYLSANLNKNILAGKQKKNKEQEHKEYLLSAITLQLQKKLFIQAIKYNFYYSKYKKQPKYYPQKSIINQYFEYSDQQYQDNIQNQCHPIHSKNLQNQIETKKYINDPRIIIMSQIFTSILKAKLYQYFKILQNAVINDEYNQQQQSQKQQIIIQNQKNYSKQQQNKRQFPTKSIKVNQNKQTIHKQVNSQKKQTLKQYFNNWKIYYLNKLLQQQSIDNNLINQQQNSFRNQNIYLLSPTSTSQSNLKQEKKKLKIFHYQQIKQRQGIFLLKILRENLSKNKIKRICQKIYTQNLLKKTFQSFLISLKLKQKSLQLSQIYSQLANNQVQDQTISNLFYKTNLLTKTFFAYKNIYFTEKLNHAIQNIIFRYSFTKIMNQSNEDVINKQTIDRFFKNKEKMLKFRIFNCLKHETINNNYGLNKIRQWQKLKKKQLLSIYFSIMSLQGKRRRIKQIKANKFYNFNITKRIFNELRKISIQEKIQRVKINQIEYILLQNKFKIIIQKLQSFLIEQKKLHKIQIMEDNLKNILLTKRIKKYLNYWRKKTIKAITYRAIQVRLTRLSQKQKLKRYYSIWYYQGLKSIQNKNSINFSGQHKDWLIKYYDNLCSLQK